GSLPDRPTCRPGHVQCRGSASQAPDGAATARTPERGDSSVVLQPVEPALQVACGDEDSASPTLCGQLAGADGFLDHVVTEGRCGGCFLRGVGQLPGHQNHPLFFLPPLPPLCGGFERPLTLRGFWGFEFGFWFLRPNRASRHQRGYGLWGQYGVMTPPARSPQRRGRAGRPAPCGAPGVVSPRARCARWSPWQLRTAWRG